MDRNNRYMRTAFLRIVAAVAPTLSCTSATEPVSNVSATVIRQTVTRSVDGSQGSVDVTLQLLISNRTSDPAYQPGCSVSLEKQDTDHGWALVWSPVCIAMAPESPLDGTLLIPAGESREVTVHVYSGWGRDGWPTEGLDGTYRLNISILSRLPDWGKIMGAEFRSRRLTTDEFTLTLSSSH